MDIEILLALQNLRLSLPDAFESFFAGISSIAEGPALVAIALIVFWSVDKRAGELAITSYMFSMTLNQLVKSIACVYRPWVRDTRIVPSDKALHGATGYSFPSGHTCGTTAAFGSFAWVTRKTRKVLSILCIIVILLIGFSRNFLGVHTPQDVLFGLLVGVLGIVLASFFCKWIARCDAQEPGHNKDIMATAAIVVACIVFLAFACFKPYPLDYVDGALLVDPADMMADNFKAAGALMGFMLAWVLQRRFAPFATDGLTMKKRVIRAIVGIVCIALVYLAAGKGFALVMPNDWAKMASMFCLSFVAVFPVPLLFNKLENRIG